MSRLTCWIQYYGTFAEKLSITKGKDLTFADDIADRFVKYHKPKMSAAEIVGYVAYVLSLDAGQIVSNGIEPAVGPMTEAIGNGEAAPDYASSQVANFFRNPMGNYKKMGNQMAFEVANAAGEYVKDGKCLVYVKKHLKYNHACPVDSHRASPKQR